MVSHDLGSTGRAELFCKPRSGVFGGDGCSGRVLLLAPVLTVMEPSDVAAGLWCHVTREPVTGPPPGRTRRRRRGTWPAGARRRARRAGHGERQCHGGGHRGDVDDPPSSASPPTLQRDDGDTDGEREPRDGSCYRVQQILKLRERHLHIPRTCRPDTCSQHQHPERRVQADCPPGALSARGGSQGAC